MLDTATKPETAGCACGGSSALPKVRVALAEAFGEGYTDPCPCAGCGRAVIPVMGIDLFDLLTGRRLCEACAKAADPQMVDVLAMVKAAYGFALTNWGPEVEELKRKLAASEKNSQPGDAPLPREDDPFGTCPLCGKTDGFLSVGPDHWMVCHVHRLKWHVGSNLFSGWREQSEQDFARNREILAGYPSVPDPSLRECLGYEQRPNFEEPPVADAPAPCDDDVPI